MSRVISPFTAVVLLLSVLIVLVAGVGLFATSKENGTLVRNSFLLRDTVAGSVLEVAPDATPESFLWELRAAPGEYTELGKTLNARLDAESATTLNRAEAIAAHLIANKVKGRPIQSTVAKAYAYITEKGLGYCADYAQVFTALALAQGIKVREWGLGFGALGSGHAFNEIFDPELNKWIFIDSYHSFYVTDTTTATPLSTVEFQQRLLDPALRGTITVQTVRDGKFRFDSADEAIDYYERGKHYFYLFWGNNVFSYDAHPVVKFLGTVSRSIEVLGAIIVGVHPKIRVLGTPENAAAARELQIIGWLMLVALSLAIVLTAALVMQMLRLRRH